MDHCQVRVDCSSDSGDYSTMLMLFKKVLRSARIAGEKKSAATNLRRLLRSIFNLVKAHCARGQTGIASVVFNELLGLMGSSPIRHFNRTLQQTYGLIRGRQVPARHTDATFNIREMAPLGSPFPWWSSCPAPCGRKCGLVSCCCSEHSGAWPSDICALLYFYHIDAGA